MISRRTIISLFLVAIIFLGIRVWMLGHRDDCERPVGTDHALPKSVYVESGTRLVEMPCDEWLPRQPVGVQLACLGDRAVGVVMVLSVAMDWRKWRERRRVRG